MLLLKAKSADSSDTQVFQEKENYVVLCWRWTQCDHKSWPVLVKLTTICKHIYRNLELGCTDAALLGQQSCGSIWKVGRTSKNADSFPVWNFFMCFIVLCLVTVSKEKKWSIRNQKLVFVSWTVWVLAIQQGAHLWTRTTYKQGEGAAILILLWLRTWR